MAYTRISDANEITARYMDSILIEQRLIDSVVADISTEFFGEKFDTPVNGYESGLRLDACRRAGAD